MNKRTKQPRPVSNKHERRVDRRNKHRKDEVLRQAHLRESLASSLR